jgi:hypothetical protein
LVTAVRLAAWFIKWRVSPIRNILSKSEVKTA